MSDNLERIHFGEDDLRWYGRIVLGVRVLREGIAFVNLVIGDGRIEQYVVPIERLMGQPADGFLKSVLGHFACPLLADWTYDALGNTEAVAAINLSYGSCREYLKAQGIKFLSTYMASPTDDDSGERCEWLALAGVTDEAFIEDVAVCLLRMTEEGSVLDDTTPPYPALLTVPTAEALKVMVEMGMVAMVDASSVGGDA